MGFGLFAFSLAFSAGVCYNAGVRKNRQFICTFLSLSKTGTANKVALCPNGCGFAFCKVIFY